MVPEARNTYIAYRAVNDHLHGSVRGDGVVGVWTGIPVQTPRRRRSRYHRASVSVSFVTWFNPRVLSIARSVTPTGFTTP